MALNEADQGYKEGSAVLLVDAEGRVLLQERDDDVPPAGIGRWAIPGGGRIGDESPLETAVREFQEETGAALRRLRHFATYAPWSDPWMKRFVLHLFIAQDDVPRDAISVLEGADFRYWSPDDALRLPVNPTTANFLGEMLDSPLYHAAQQRLATGERWVTVLEIDRWGHVLIVRPADTGRPGSWSLPGGLVGPGESPDRSGLRHFQEATGHTLDTLKLFRAYRRDTALPSGPAPQTHVYYYDADLQPEVLDLQPGREARYVAPGELARTAMAVYARTILEQFFESPAYKGMFH